MKYKGLVLVLMVAFCVRMHAEVPIVAPDLSQPTGIAPAYFGPNAFPIPEMLDGRTQNHLRLELAGDGYFGYNGDRTADIFARVSVPLFTRWANLTVWMPVYEWYDQYDGKGSGAGDAYISTDVQVLHDSWFHSSKSRWIPQATIRLAMKTASGGQFERRRHYDCPGYFFDFSMGKSFYFGKGKSFPYADAENSLIELRLAGSAGFLCCQTDNGRQNDAIMYGLQLLLKHEYVSLQATWAGYWGWERHGDAPMSLRARLAGHVQGFEPFVQYQWGIKDYPFHQVRLGLAYHIDILHSKTR